MSALQEVMTEISYKNRGRRMHSRESVNRYKIISTLVPGEQTPGFFVCCNAPTCCPCCSSCFFCCDDAEYIIMKREASKYILIRENSLEWNEPTMIMGDGSCCGVDPCIYDIQDNVNVLYFDDPIFDRMKEQTRCCNECRTCCCGGKGERIEMDTPCCCNLCQKGKCPCPCIPSFCPNSLFPCILRHEMYLEDVQKSLYELTRARKNAKKNELYQDEQGYIPTISNPSIQFQSNLTPTTDNRMNR